MPEYNPKPYTYVRPNKLHIVVYLVTVVIGFLFLLGAVRYGQAFAYLPWLRDPMAQGNLNTLLTGLTIAILLYAVFAMITTLAKHRRIRARQLNARQRGERWDW